MLQSRGKPQHKTYYLLTLEEAPTFLIFYDCWRGSSSSYYSDRQTCFAFLLAVWRLCESMEEAFPFPRPSRQHCLLWFHLERVWQKVMETDGGPTPVNWETDKHGERRSGRRLSSHSHIPKVCWDKSVKKCSRREEKKKKTEVAQTRQHIR